MNGDVLAENTCFFLALNSTRLLEPLLLVKSDSKRSRPQRQGSLASRRLQRYRYQASYLPCTVVCISINFAEREHVIDMQQKEVGDKTEPCGTPALTGMSHEVHPSARTRVFRSCRKSEIQ